LFQATLPLEKRIAQADIPLKDLWQGEEEVKWFKGEKGIEFHISLTAQDFGKRALSIHYLMKQRLTCVLEKAAPKKTSKKKKGDAASAAGSSDSLLPPLPPTEKLNSLFDELLNQLSPPPETRASMMLLPASNKWALICQQRLVEVCLCTVSHSFIYSRLRLTHTTIIQLETERP